MITYQDIYDILRKEKYSEQLQPLPKNFFEELVAYLKEKKEITSQENPLFSDTIEKTKKQFENTIAIIKEIFLRRKKKILSMAFIASETGISKKDFENLLQFEKELFENVLKELKKTEEKIALLLNGKKQNSLKNKLVMFNQDTGSFLNSDGETLGPFKKGEVANLPFEIAEILIQDGKAEEINKD